MVLVVILHVTIWAEDQVSGRTVTPWGTLSAVLAPARMPLFFAMSGLLATAALRRGLPAVGPRTAGLAFVYVLWTGLLTARQWLPAARTDGDRAPTLVDLLSTLVVPTAMWYIWALGLFYVATWALVRALGRRSAVALVPLAAVSAASPAVAVWSTPDLDMTNLAAAAGSFVWFYAGVHGHQLVDRLQATTTPGRLAAATGVYSIAAAAAAALGVLVQVGPLLAPLAVLVAVQAFALAPDGGRLAGALQWIGQLTLPVYVLHFFAISAVSAAAKLTGLGELIQRDLHLWGAVLPPALAVGIVVACRLTGQMIMGSRARWLLVGPAWLTRAGRPHPFPVAPLVSRQRAA